MPGKLGILAGSGDLPARVRDAARRQGRDVFVVAFRGQTDQETTEETAHVWTRIGAAGEILDALRGAGVADLVMAGGIRRPGWLELRPDARAAQFLGQVGRRAFAGDDSLLTAIVGALEKEEGFRILKVEDILGDARAERGVYGQHAPDEEARADIRVGIEVAKALGRLDIGQAVVVQQGVVLGVEAAEGTDALVERTASLARSGPGGVLVKVRKPQQESRADMPTIGPTTVRVAAEAGLRGIAVEASGGLLVDRDQVIAEADRAGLFVVGVESNDSASE